MKITIKIEGPVASGKTMLLRELELQFCKDLIDINNPEFKMTHELDKHTLTLEMPDNFIVGYLPK